MQLLDGMDGSRVKPDASSFHGVMMACGRAKEVTLVTDLLKEVGTEGWAGPRRVGGGARLVWSCLTVSEAHWRGSESWCGVVWGCRWRRRGWRPRR